MSNVGCTYELAHVFKCNYEANNVITSINIKSKYEVKNKGG